MKHGKSHTPIARTLIATAISACFAPLVFALPVAPTVINGNATFVQNGNVLTVTNSNQAIINWQSFSIGSNETTKFVQPSASSSVLNRVTSSDPSLLLGSLQSNGRVYLINAAGILVGQGARLDVAGFVASSLNLSDSDFLANRLRFTETQGAGKVQNLGEIVTPNGGNVYLVAPQVENSGIISAPNGEVLLAAGQRVELIDTATPGVRIEVIGSVGDAINLGTITADAGRIGIAGVLVKNSGTLNASSVVSEGGRIFLKARTDTLVDGNSQITATGTKGGRIEVLGNRVAVMDNAQLDASGQTAGGTVLVGGDYQGKNASIQNSASTTFDKLASIKADAIETGNGGKIVLWSDGTTNADGNISARAGENGGDGGFVEVSGKQLLNYRGLTDTRAPRGKTGTLLLDPTSINLIAGAGTDGGGTLYGDNITTNLGASNVILQTSSGGTGAITFTAGNYNFSGATAANALTLLAFSDGSTSLGNISLPSGTFITMKAGALLTMVAGWDGFSTATPAVVNGFGNISLTGASISAPGSTTLHAGNNIDFLNSSSVTTGAGEMKVKARGSVTLNSSTLSASGTAQSVEAITGAVTLQAGAGAPAAIAYYGSGAQTVKGASISLAADTTASSNKTAQISSSLAGSSQTVQATVGAITLTAGNLGTNNFAGITAKASQVISAAGAINISAGTGGASNAAGISSDGAQNITAGSIALTGGDSTGFGRAEIKATGAQTITATSGNITLTGGSVSKDNQASIDSNTSQTITVSGNMTLQGGTAGAALVTGPTQTINIGGNLTMLGGSGSIVDSYGLAAPAAIGYDSGSNITLGVAGSITMSGSFPLNPSMIGAAAGLATLDLSGADINLGVGSHLGNWDGSAGGSIVLTGTGTAIQQLPGAAIVTDTLTATANTDIVLNGANKVKFVNLDASSAGFVSYHTATLSTTHIDASAAINQSITVTGDAGSGNIALGSISTSGTGAVMVSAQKAILDDNGSGVANVTTGSGTVTLVSTGGTGVPGELAISTDVATSGTITASVSGGAHGSIVIRDVGANQSSMALLNASAATAEGHLGYYRYGNMSLANISLSQRGTDSVGIGASGDISLPSGYLFGAGSADAKLFAGGDLLVNGGSLSMRANNNAIFAAGQINVSTGRAITSDPGKPLNVTASSILLNGGALTADADLTVITPGNVDLLAGGLLESTNGKLIFLADNLNVTNGAVNGKLGIDGTLFGGITLGAFAGGTGTMSAANGIVDLAMGGSGIEMYNGSYISSIDPTQPEGGLIKLFFSSLTSGGSMIDNVAAFDGGYKVNGSFTTLGTGLDVTYGQFDNAVTSQIVGDAAKATDATDTGLADGTDSTGTLLAGAGDDKTGTAQSTSGTTDSNSFGSSESGDGTSGESSSDSKKEGTDNAQNTKKKPAQCSASA